MEIPEHTEFAIEFDCPERYTAYLQKSLPEFYHDYLRKKSSPGKRSGSAYPGSDLYWKPVLSSPFSRGRTSFRYAGKGKKKSLRQLRFLFTYVREILLEDTFALLRKIDHWCSKNELEMECVVNDWGMADFIRKETKHLLPCLGTLLNKRKKIPVSITKKASETCTARTVSMQIFTRNF